MRWPLLAASFWCLTSSAGCRDSSPESAATRVGASAAGQEVSFDRLNQCSHDSECLDLGPYCPRQCNTLVAFHPDAMEEWMEANLLIRNFRPDEHGPCDFECRGPFWGAVCVDGRCRPRPARPPTSICWAPGQTRIECMELFRQFGKASEFDPDLGERCLALCDGRAKGRARELLERIPGPDATRHQTVVYIVDYVPCSECARLTAK